MKTNLNEMFKTRSSSQKFALLRREQQNHWRQFSSRSLRTMVLAQHAQKQQQRTYNNSAIGNIEWRPVVSADIEIQKVGDLAVRHSVPKIANGPTQNQRERQSSGVEHAAVLPEQNRDNGQSCHGKSDQQSSSKGRRGISKEAKSGAGVFQMSQTKKSRNDVDCIFQRNGLRNGSFGNPIQQQHGKCDQQRARGHG
jgi:hypothetical protein